MQSSGSVVKIKIHFVSFQLVLTSSFREPNHHSPTNEPFSQMYFKIPLLSSDLKLSNTKPGGTVSALHFFVKQLPTMAF